MGGCAKSQDGPDPRQVLLSKQLMAGQMRVPSFCVILCFLSLWPRWTCYPFKPEVDSLGCSPGVCVTNTSATLCFNCFPMQVLQPYCQERILILEA